MIFPAHNQDVEKFAEKFSENEWKKIAEIQIETKFFLLEHLILSVVLENPPKITIVTEAPQVKDETHETEEIENGIEEIEMNEKEENKDVLITETPSKLQVASRFPEARVSIF